MKNFASDKLVCLSSVNANGKKDETYRYGATEISVSEFTDLVDDKKCVVITFDRSRRNSSWKKDVADYFGVDISTCAFDKYSVYGKAV
jgi:hypothetical protein